MGKMKIKVKPEGAKLVFTGGDLDVDLHPAHGYVRPIHNVIVTHSHHDEHHEEPVEHHEIEHEEEEDHSGHHGWHHSYHHDEHGGHDDEGYGFRHFSHWPNSLHGEQSFLGNDFYHNDHHGNHGGHFRDEIEDSHEPETATKHAGEDDDAYSRHNIGGANEDTKEREEPEMAYQRSFYDRRTDAEIFGKKIYPDDVAAPTHKSNIQDKFEKFSSKIAPGFKVDKDDTDDGSARGTISPFDDDNDARNEGAMRNSEERKQGNDVEENARHSMSKINTKELERIASKIKPDIPAEDEFPVKETAGNTKDFGSPSQVYVNMSGMPHNYGDEEKELDYPTQNRDLEPDIAQNRNERPQGDYYPSEERWNEPHDDNEDEDEGYKKSINEFRNRASRLARISNEAAKKKDERPPIIVHPDGDPRDRQLRKAFYEYNHRPTLTQHMATISDFNVRSRIARRTRRANSAIPRRTRRANSAMPRRTANVKRSLMVDRLIARLQRSW
eukprot:gene15150-6339_t